MRVVAITGASAGVGRAAAREFARNGHQVGLIARGAGGLKGALQDIETEGGRGVIAQADVSDHEQVEQAASQIEDELGPIDVWVNNAMATVFSRFGDLTAEEFRRVTDVTYFGTVNGTMSALRRMLPRDRGVIVQVGSALSYRAIPLQSAYCGAKHAVKGFTQSLRTELLHDKSNVQVTMVQLPALNTPQFDWARTKLGPAQPIPPIYQPEVAAKAIVWAADNPRREIRVGIPSVLSILATNLFPGLLDRYLALTGFDSQQSDRETGMTEDNLVDAVDEAVDFGARGRFDDRSHGSSPQFWATTHRPVLGAAAGSLAAALLLKRKR